jgi:hypothetical protein
MFSENNAYERLDEKNESVQTEEQSSITPLVETSETSTLTLTLTPTPAEENPTEEFKDEHEEYLIKEDIEESAPEQTPILETTQAEPTIPDSTAETSANKCMMGCIVM